ncbi:hypothetical protein BDW60DRAFT_184327 [Aspergillus nidulans var. acristatus]
MTIYSKLSLRTGIMPRASIFHLCCLSISYCFLFLFFALVSLSSSFLSTSSAH